MGILLFQDKKKPRAHIARGSPRVLGGNLWLAQCECTLHYSPVAREAAEEGIRCTSSQSFRGKGDTGRLPAAYNFRHCNYSGIPFLHIIIFKSCGPTIHRDPFEICLSG